MPISQGKNAGIAGSFVGILIGGLGTQRAFNYEVTGHSGAISYPNIVRTGRGTDATATAHIGGGAVTSITAVTAGFGYNAAAATITGGGGTGAAATVTLAAGAATAYVVTAGGSGYTSVPTVAVTESAGATPVTKLADPQGSGKLAAIYQFTGVPNPDLPKFATGTVRHVMQTQGPNLTPVDFMDVPVRFTNIAWDHPEKSTDLWMAELTWELAGNPVLTWQGQQVTISVPTANDKQTYEGLAKVYDPQFIQTTATVRVDCETVGNDNTAEVAKLAAVAASLLAPMVNLQLITLSMTRTESNGLALVGQFGYTNSAQAITFPQTYSTRSGTSPYTDALAQIVDSATTDAIEANAQWLAFQTQAYALGLRVSSINPFKKLVVFEYINPGITLQGLTASDDRLIECQLSGSAIQVYVQNNYAMAGGYREITLSRQRVTGKPIRRFIVSRMLKGTKIPEGSPSTIGSGAVVMPPVGAMNSDTFQGLAVGTVLYKGPAYTVNLNLLTGANSIFFFMGFNFFSDANGIFTSVPQSLFRYKLVQQSSSTVGSTTPAFEDIANLGLTGAISRPSSASFAAFFAPGDVCS